MAQDIDQDTSTDWGPTEVPRYLTIALGYSKNRALYEMEQ